MGLLGSSTQHALDCRVDVKLSCVFHSLHACLKDYTDEFCLVRMGGPNRLARLGKLLAPPCGEAAGNQKPSMSYVSPPMPTKTTPHFSTPLLLLLYNLQSPSLRMASIRIQIVNATCLAHKEVESVKNLGIFMVNLIQKYNISRFVTTYMCMCKSLKNSQH